MIHLLYSLLWNLTLIAVAALALWLLCFARSMRERPALRHGLWLLLLIKMITPPIVPLPVLPAASRDIYSVETGGAVAPNSIDSANRISSPAEIPSAQPLPSRINPESQTRTVVLIAWGVVSMSLFVTSVLWLMAIQQLRRFKRLLVDSLNTSYRSSAALNSVAQKFGLSRLPSIVVVNGTCSPMLWIFGQRAKIFLPQGIDESSCDERLCHILAHEVAHIVRYDHISSLIAFLVTSIFWWNPVAWFARRQMLLAAETSCDALAIERLAGSRKSYATTLVEVSDFVLKSKSVSPLLVVPFGESHSLRRRIEMIADIRVKSALSGPGRFAVIGVGILALMLVPVQAQEVIEESSTATSSATDPPKEPAPDVANAPRVGTQAQRPVAEIRNEKEVINRAQDNQPKIKNARLVTWHGKDGSSRAYLFETRQAADAFANTIAAFKIAEQIKVVISEKDIEMFDDDRKILTTRPNVAKQLGLNSDKFVLLSGTRDQHTRVEAVIVALGGE